MKLNMPNLNTNLTSRSTNDVEPSSVKVDVKPTKNLQEEIARRLARIAQVNTNDVTPSKIDVISGKIQTKTFNHTEDKYQVIITLLRSETNKFNNKIDNVYRIMMEDKGKDYIYEFTSLSASLEIGESAECLMTVCYVPNQAYSRNYFTPVTLKKI